MAKSDEPLQRKLAVPFQIKLGPDTVITDGVFTLTSKETGQVNIVGYDNDGFAKIQLLPPQKLKIPRNLKEILDEGIEIGSEISRSRGRGKEFGQYKYYRKTDGNYFARVFSGDRSRPYPLGRLTERASSISMIARSIVQNFGKNEFSKIQLSKILEKNSQKHIAQGQVLKSGLDVLRFEGYLERRELPKSRGRLKELFKATDKLVELIMPTPGQVQQT